MKTNREDLNPQKDFLLSFNKSICYKKVLLLNCKKTKSLDLSLRMVMVKNKVKLN